MTSDKTRVLLEAQRQSRQAGEKPHILIGTATCGRAAGAMDVLKAVREELAKHKIDALVSEVGCIGLCYAEPLMDIVSPGRPAIAYRNVTAKMIPDLIEDYFIKDNPRADLALGTFSDEPVDGIPCLFDLPVLKSQVRITLRNCGHINPDSIHDYIAAGGYGGLKKALLKMTPQQVIDELKQSGLRGRGGAGFPTGLKWQFCRDAEADQKYIICNADEGDPGAFMDRSIMEGDPHSVIEGMAIGAYAMGTSKGYIYIRSEYPLAVKRVHLALKKAAEEGFLGENILGSGFNFSVSVKEGAGAFVCGEETAMIASIEGKRGMPRSRPPFPAQSGLWGKPTNINNVKTLATVAIIISQGGDWYSRIGTEKSKGTAIFALTGKIRHMGLVEVPMGTPLRDIIYEIGGGIPNDKEIKAVQTGGPSGGCLPASLLDSSVDYESLAAAGSIMGSGGMVVMDEDTCMVDVARYFLSFTQRESCGKCVPCRLGTKQMLGILENICEGKGQPGDIELLLETAKSVKTASLCALGGTAPNPVLTTIRYFKEEYEEHIKEHRCRGGICKELITYTIIDDKCPGCGLCVKPCPVDAITFMGKKKPVILDQEKCTKCGACLDACRLGAIEVR
jgi:NADH:ubiquinone oxidoreductase subunit F (NADH-binding)/(2Fe-2S) ferredoxin